MKVYFGIGQSFKCDVIQVNGDCIKIMVGPEYYTKNVVDYVDFIVEADPNYSLNLDNMINCTEVFDSIRLDLNDRFVSKMIAKEDDLPIMRINRIRYRAFITNDNVVIKVTAHYEAYYNMCSILAHASDFPRVASKEDAYNYLLDLMDKNGWDHMSLTFIGDDENTVKMTIDSPKTIIARDTRNYNTRIEEGAHSPKITNIDNKDDIKEIGFEYRGLLSRIGITTWSSNITEVQV